MSVPRTGPTQRVVWPSRTPLRYPTADTSIHLTNADVAPKLSCEALLDLVHWVERRGRHERLPGDGDRLACAASTAATAPDLLAEPADPAAVAGGAGHEGERE